MIVSDQQKPKVLTNNALVALFAFLLVATIGSGVTLLFFTVSSASTRLYYADLIEASQLAIQANITVLQAEARVTLADTVTLQGIIVVEQGLVQQVSYLVLQKITPCFFTTTSSPPAFGRGGWKWF